MRHMRLAPLAMVGLSFGAAAALATPPQYTIVDMGILDPGDFGSQGFDISPDGIFATGRSLGDAGAAFVWTQNGGQVGLPNLDSRPFGRGNGVNNAGVIVGTGATTAFGSSPLPLIWENGVVSQLALPNGETLGRAYDINGAGIAVGSVDGGSSEQGVIYSRGSASLITATTPGGSFMRTAFDINNAGLVVGFGIDPNNAARNVGFVYDIGADMAFEVGALPGDNGALAFGVSNGGHIVGASMLNQGAGMPFVWTQADGMSAIGLPANTSQGSAEGVNSSGLVVGTASGAFAVPFLYDGTMTYALADLLPDGSGWDLSMNTFSSATGISEGGIIVGTGVYNGEVRAYAMIPIPAPATLGVFILAAAGGRRRRPKARADQTRR